MRRLLAIPASALPAVVRRVLAIEPVRRMVQGELARLGRTVTSSAAGPGLPGFTDRHGTVHHLDLLGATAGAAVAGRILEVGCYDGSVAFELTRRPGTTVVASDLARYYVVQRPRQVTFVEDDVTESTLEPGGFDRAA